MVLVSRSSSSSSGSSSSIAAAAAAAAVALLGSKVGTRGVHVGLVNLLFALCPRFSVFGVVATATTLTSVSLLQRLVSPRRIVRFLLVVRQKTHEGAVYKSVVGRECRVFICVWLQWRSPLEVPG